MKFQITKKDKREILEDFVEHLQISGVTFAQEVEDEGTNKTSLEEFTNIKELISSFMSMGKVNKDDEDE